jgi:hypothetical protein
MGMRMRYKTVYTSFISVFKLFTYPHANFSVYLCDSYAQCKMPIRPTARSRSSTKVTLISTTLGSFGKRGHYHAFFDWCVGKPYT